MSQWEMGCTQVSPDRVVVQTIGFRGNIYKAACISKTNHLTSLLHLGSHLLVLQNLSLDESIIVTLENAPLKHVKLLEHLQICMNLSSTGYLQRSPQAHHLDQLTTVLSASMCAVPHLHSFLCKKGKILKTRFVLVFSLLTKGRNANGEPAHMDADKNSCQLVR